MKTTAISLLLLLCMLFLASCGIVSVDPEKTGETEASGGPGTTAGDKTVVPDWTTDGATYPTSDLKCYFEFAEVGASPLPQATYAYLADGSEFTLPVISTSRAACVTYGITELDGREYVLYYQPTYYNGACEDAYLLYAVENGELKVMRSGHVEFEVSSVRPLPPVDIDGVMAFVDEINDIWQHSRLLFTTDIYTVGRNLYGRSDGARHLLDGMAYFLVPDGRNIESYYYVEELIRLDSEFGLDDPSIDTIYTARQKLEIANHVMEGNASGDPSDEWFIDEAWKLVQDINRIYGTDFVKDECDVHRAQWGEKSLRWYKADPESVMHVSFIENEDGSWTTGMEHCYFYYEYAPDRIDSEKYGSDIVQLFGLALDLTDDDLKEAGYKPTGGEGDLDMAAEYMANYVAGLFTELPDGNYFKCSDSGVSRFERHVTPSYTHWANVALMPVDYSNWGAAYGDIEGMLCAEPEYYGYITIFMNIMTVRSADGSIHVSLNWDE